MTPRKKTNPPDDLILGWRVVHPDLRSSNGYRWPYPGTWAEAPLPAGRKFTTGGDGCPTFPGDGLCIARTWQGAASGGIPAATALLVAYSPDDVLADTRHKIRVKRCQVLEVFDPQRLIRSGILARANLTGANLTRADLTRADLTDANLTGAYLTRADLAGADLTGADLTRANLAGANLTRADLARADLARADLTRANLADANLTRADLTRADLTRAYGTPFGGMPDGWVLNATGLWERSK